MTLSVPLFLATLALAAAAAALTRPHAVHAAMWLVAGLLAQAACFFALGAGFAGAVQIVVYAGAVLVVVVFVVLTLDLSPEAVARERARLRGSTLAPALVAVAVLAPFVPLATVTPSAGEEAPGAAGGTAPADVGALLFGPWALAVELASFLLLAGLVAVRHVGRRDTPGPHDGKGEGRTAP